MHRDGNAMVSSVTQCASPLQSWLPRQLVIPCLASLSPTYLLPSLPPGSSPITSAFRRLSTTPGGGGSVRAPRTALSAAALGSWLTRHAAAIRGLHLQLDPNTAHDMDRWVAKEGRGPASEWP
jgi:hypothetical protein